MSKSHPVFLPAIFILFFYFIEVSSNCYASIYKVFMDFEQSCRFAPLKVGKGAGHLNFAGNHYAAAMAEPGSPKKVRFIFPKEGGTISIWMSMRSKKM